MILEGMINALRGILRIPQGSQIRKNYGGKDNSQDDLLSKNAYVSAILDITVDDVCPSEEPLSIHYDDNTPEVTQKKLQSICDSFNKIIKWAVRDLLSKGVSVYDAKVHDTTKKLLLIPNLDNLEFYLTRSLDVVAVSVDDNHKRVNLLDKLVFINFDKTSLTKIEDANVDSNINTSDLLFKVTPLPIQFKNAEDTLRNLQNAEESVAKYRNLLRPARWANVDIGTAQGNTQTETINSISSAINANSMSLSQTYSEYDDNIPVLPNRKGLGRVDIVSDIPTADISQLADVNYWVGKLGLIGRFPTTYINFNEALGSTAVSLIRADLRYAKLIKSVGSLVVCTINDYIVKSSFIKWNPYVTIETIPTAQDDDVIAALESHTDLIDKIYNFVIGDDSEEPVAFKTERLDLIKTLFATSTSSPMLDEWFNTFHDFIEENIKNDLFDTNIEEDESGSEGTDFSGDDFSEEGLGDEFDAGGIDLPSNDEISEDGDFAGTEVEGEFVDESTE